MMSEANHQICQRMILKNSRDFIFTIFDDKVENRLQLVKKLKKIIIPTFECPAHITDTSYQNLYELVLQHNLSDGVIFPQSMANILPTWSTHDILRTYYENDFIHILDVDRIHMHLDALKSNWWIMSRINDLYYQILLLCYLIGDIHTVEQMKGVCGQKWNPAEYIQFILSYIINTIARREDKEVYRLAKCKLDHLIACAEKSEHHEYIHVMQLIKSLLCDDIGYTVHLLIDQHVDFDLSMEEIVEVLIKMDIVDMVETKDAIASLVFTDLLHYELGSIGHILINYLDGIDEETRNNILYRVATKYEKEMYYGYARCIYHYLGMDEMARKMELENINIIRALSF